MRLRGRVGVLTGADSDLGRSIARALAAEGMSLMMVARPGTHVRDLAEALEQEYGVRCFPAAADVENPQAVDRLLMHAEQHIGAIDALISTIAGCVGAALRPTMEQRGRGLTIEVADPSEVAHVVERCVGALKLADSGP